MHHKCREGMCLVNGVRRRGFEKAAHTGPTFFERPQRG